MSETIESEQIAEWVSEVTGARNVALAAPDVGGRSREILLVTAVMPDGAALDCVLKTDTGEGAFSGTAFTPGREAAVLRALEGRGVPLPRIIAVSDAGDRFLMRTLPGSADWVFGSEDRRREVVRGFIAATAALHALDVHSLDLPESPPGSPTDAVLEDFERHRRGYLDLSVRHPLVDEALEWLDRHPPAEFERAVLVHGDLGPDNVLHEDGAVTGLIDWERARVGDPMEDLASLWFRKCVLRRDEDLADWFSAYAAASGVESTETAWSTAGSPQCCGRRSACCESSTTRRVATSMWPDR